VQYFLKSPKFLWTHFLIIPKFQLVRSHGCTHLSKNYNFLKNLMTFQKILWLFEKSIWLFEKSWWLFEKSNWFVGKANLQTPNLFHSHLYESFTQHCPSPSTLIIININTQNVLAPSTMAFTSTRTLGFLAWTLFGIGAISCAFALDRNTWCGGNTSLNDFMNSRKSILHDG
jgi:hypothetical protein